jgi:Cu/Ag efflux protein CusF
MKRLDLPASGRSNLRQIAIDRWSKLSGEDEVKMQRSGIIAAGAALLIAISAAQAQTGKPVDGVVVKIDRSLGKITLRHGEIPNLHMDAMTMVFAVRDSATLDGLKAGDKVRFEAEDIDGKKTVTEIQPVR